MRHPLFVGRLRTLRNISCGRRRQGGPRLFDCVEGSELVAPKPMRAAKRR